MCVSICVHVQNTLLANKYYRTYCEKSNPIYIIRLSKQLFYYTIICLKAEKETLLGVENALLFLHLKFFNFC